MPSAGPLDAAPCLANPLRKKLTWFVATSLALALLLALALPIGAQAKKKKKDKRPPIAALVTTGDADNDGRLDTITIKYSEKVRWAKVRMKAKRARAKTAFTVSRHKVLSVKASGKIVTLKVSETDDVNTAERPIVKYAPVKKRKRGVSDRAGNQAYSAVVKPRDGIAPRVLSARTTDADADGQVDGVDINYSETVSGADSAAISVPGRTLQYASASGSKVGTVLTELGVDSDARPVVVAGAGAATDAAGNAQTEATTVNADDGTPPAMVAAITRDTDADGKIDRIRVTFSESVAHAAEGAGGSLRAIGYTTVAVSAATGTAIDLDFAEGGAPNTGAKPNVELLGSGQPVTDANGNVAAPGNFAATSDGAAPVLVSARLRDTDFNGRVDTVAAAFSETVTYTSTPLAFVTTANPSVLGTLLSTGVSIGAVVNVAITEVGGCCNTNLPTVPDPVPVQYTAPGAGGVVDTALLPAVAGTVNATDGAGPVITYAETEDADADGWLDHVYVGFSETVTLAGSPLAVASGQRALDTNPPNQPVVVSSGPHAGQVKLTLQELGIDDTGDRPTVTYQPPNGSSYVRDQYTNDAPAGALPFTGTADKASPVMRSSQATDETVVDGRIDTITSVWTEPVQTVAAPGFAVGAQNPPSGYTPPSVASGSTASGQTVTTPLNPSPNPDRDVYFETTYMLSGGVSDTAATPNGGVAPSSYVSQTANCLDIEEASGTHDDSTANATNNLAASGDRHLGTLCGGDTDYYKFTLAGGTVSKVLFSAAAEALSLPGRNGGYDPFTVSGPGSPTHTTTFIAGVGWQLEFTADAGGGTYTVGIADTNTPVADYGYCISRAEGAGSPSCSLRQGDLAITEMLDQAADGNTSVFPYVEFKNLTPTSVQSTDIELLQLSVDGQTCAVQQRSDTPATIPSGGYFIISASDMPLTTLDFACTGMPTVDYTKEVALFSTDGYVDVVNLGSGVSTPAHTTVQVRSGTSYETSTGNDDGPGGWCASIDYHGTPAAVNSQCDEFRLEEATFMPTSSDRDGKVMIEIRGNSPINASFSLLANWQIRVRPQGATAKTFTLSSTANPNANGFYVLADSPDGGGDTYVPFYSAQVSDLDDYLRADTPGSINLLRPSDACATDAPADTVGFIPSISGSLTPADAEGQCPAYVVEPYSHPLGFAAADTFQRKPYASYSDNNLTDWCKKTPWTPLSVNNECVIQQ